MPSFCAVTNCNDRYGHSENISFHKFPLKRIDLLKQWEAFIQKQRGSDWHASRWSSLCSRHFREEDFRSLNERKTLKKSAVPSILLVDDVKVCNSNVKKTTLKPNLVNKIKDVTVPKTDSNKQERKITKIVNGLTKSNCRLCGTKAIPAATFQTNYELYGILQKCFPTLNIEQDDPLPKNLCSECLQNLEQFGEFVDKVWATQDELQRKYRTRTTEKSLKIKQEPVVVRVKQETLDSSSNGDGKNIDEQQIDDYDAGCETLQEAEEEDDQKLDFCDFPIMNDCDIMEIINLDDPFINIPDDDNTNVNKAEKSKSNLQSLPSAHDLLQSHLLMEEHNYANIESDDFKEEQNFYKTERCESNEVNYHTHNQQEPLSSSQLITNSINILDQTTTNKPSQNSQLVNNTSVLNIPPPPCPDTIQRSLKPIVTSVSAIQQPSKPNGIVVLNESIVTSSSGFKLHDCMVCHLKYFSIETLKEHYTQTHGTPMVSLPMVSLPNINITPNPNNTKCKIEMESTELCNVIEPNNNEKSILSHEQEETQQLDKTDAEYCVNKENVVNNANSRKKNAKFKKSCLENIKKTTGRRKSYNLNMMASYYQELRKLYQRLQKKCRNLEQNVEQLQLLPSLLQTKEKKNISSPNKKSNTEVKISGNIRSTQNANQQRLSCNICSKTFGNSNSLRQHMITHSNERKHVCDLCQRLFKRRNGLLQHFKGFHLKMKPFSCPVCAHTYALKCDMLRCKHSILKGVSSQQQMA